MPSHIPAKMELGTAPIIAADTISGYIQGLLEGTEFKQTAYAQDRGSGKAALAIFLQKATGKVNDTKIYDGKLAA